MTYPKHPPPSIRRAGWIGAALWTLGVSAPVQALDGPHPSAATPQTVKAPQGPGSLRGLSDDPSVNVFAGQAEYEVPLELPEGSRGFAPKLSLAYRGDLGNGPLGLGWTLGLVEIVRSQQQGVPSYDPSDELVLHGFGSAGRLVRISDGTYRMEGRGNDIKVEFERGGFRVWDSDGLQYVIGVSPEARKHDPDSAGRISAWRVQEVVDPEGHSIRFEYDRDRGQLYLSQVTWGPDDAFRVEFEHGPRPDSAESFRDGFHVVTALRTQAIHVYAFDELKRVYDLEYCSRMEGDVTDCGDISVSRMTGIRMRGRGGAGSLPALHFEYAGGRDPEVQAMTGIDNWRLNVDGVSMLDVDGDGATDLARMAGGEHSYRRNLGGEFSAEVSLPGSSAYLFDVRLADVEGFARPNLIQADGVSEWSVSRLQNGRWQAPVRWAGTAGLHPGGSDNVMLDVNGDGRVDLLRLGSDEMWLHLGEEGGLES